MTILHLDMDAFFASVEQRDDPTLRGKPVLVGGSGSRGVVSAASYEARRFGCRSAMPMAEARRLCPQAIVRPVRGERYAELAREVMTILGEHSPLIERLSIDEAFVDLSGTERLHNAPWRDVADGIRAEIRRRVDLPSSAGVAPNKFLAKLASDLAKPDGTLIVDETWLRATLPTLPVSRLWGVGPATERRLVSLGLRTFGDLVRAPEGLVRRAVGDGAVRLRELAAGHDERVVVPERDAKSIGAERTFGADVTDLATLRTELLHQVEQVSRRLRGAGQSARTITVKIRAGDFTTITRRSTIAEAVDDTTAIWREVESILARWMADANADGSATRLPVAIRLIGVSLGGLVATTAESTLFPDRERERRRAADLAADAVRKKFGADAIGRAGGKVAGQGGGRRGGPVDGRTDDR